MLSCAGFELPLDRPLIMGVVNLTPDSFSGDGHAKNIQAAIIHARQLIAEGADFLDIGAESSRPGAEPVSLQDELGRLVPVLEELAGCGIPLSVDTYKPEVMRAAIAHGAAMINDIFALRMPGAMEAVAESRCAVCLMHMQGEPLSMQHEPHYQDVVSEVRSFLIGRINALTEIGVDRQRIVIDPGIGFGKTLKHNLELLRRLEDVCIDGLPLLAGISRKSMLGTITGLPVGQRLSASVAAALFAFRHGARILRVHDVLETRSALAVWQALEN